jgi:anti-sigma regulatory factor (Ser/Thr protein kinase)
MPARDAREERVPVSPRRAAELPRAASAAATARDSLASWFAADLDAEMLYSAQLAVSELATNAYLHGRGRITLRADLDRDRLLVEVSDEGSGFERVVRPHHLQGLGGRGLKIVDAEASRWGIRDGATRVWFELERPGPRVTRKPPATG